MKTVSIYDLDFLTTSDIAKCMRVSQETVRNWVKANKLNAFVVGDVIRVSQESFKEFITENTK